MEYLGFILIFVNLIISYILIQKYIKYLEVREYLDNIKSKVLEVIEDYNTIRNGYIKGSLLYESNTYSYKIFVRETKRFTNNESEIIIKNVEIYCLDSNTRDIIKTYIYSITPSILNTSDVTWLKLHEDIKERRKQKLNKIIELIDESKDRKQNNTK